MISLFYGQCGNQIGDVLYSKINEDINLCKRNSDYHKQLLNKWFNTSKSNKLHPRSILIDTEQKSISSQHKFKNIITSSSGGAANSWALGYFEYGKLLMCEIKESIRKEMEKSNIPLSFLNILSCAGGTGSGVGTYVIEQLKNDFPKNVIVNAVILPYVNGEVVTQSYNCVLTLSKIYSKSCATFLLENDRLFYNCVNSLNIKDVKLEDLNTLITKQLLSIFQPIRSIQTLDILQKLCEDPLFKFLQVKLAPLSKLDDPSNWNALLLSLSRQSRFDLQQRSQSKISLKTKNVSTALICRGSHNPIERDVQWFKESSFSKTLQIYQSKRKLFELENCLSVVSNGNNVYLPLRQIFQDATNLYSYGAYLHHYKKFGVDENYFSDSLSNFETILMNYKSV